MEEKGTKKAKRKPGDARGEEKRDKSTEEKGGE